jgi:hypothetical protein
MNAIFEALRARTSDLKGYLATNDEVARLHQYINNAEHVILLEIYDTLPVCGMRVAFSVDVRGNPEPPGDDSNDDYEYDSTRDHEFYWETPSQVLERIKHPCAGSAAFAAGFVPIGNCAYGGDDYFLGTVSSSKALVGLYEVYYDWYDANRHVLVMPDGVKLVTPAFSKALTVARFGSGMRRMD